MERLLLPEEVAEALGISVKTLYNWRALGLGPVGVRVGKYLRFRESAVDAYIASLEGPSNVTPLRRRTA